MAQGNHSEAAGSQQERNEEWNASIIVLLIGGPNACADRGNSCSPRSHARAPKTSRVGVVARAPLVHSQRSLRTGKHRIAVVGWVSLESLSQLAARVVCGSRTPVVSRGTR